MSESCPVWTEDAAVCPRGQAREWYDREYGVMECIDCPGDPLVRMRGDGYDEQADELVRLRAQVAAVRELHAGRPLTGWESLFCAECDDGWPCPTIQLLDGEVAP